jgi:hypothetical protein
MTTGPLTKEQLQAMLESILDNTTSGNNRAIAQNYVVQLSIRNMNKQERDECEAFIDRAMKEFAPQKQVNSRVY